MAEPIKPSELRIGDAVTMRYPNGILQAAVLENTAGGSMAFRFGEFLREPVGPVLDIVYNTNGRWSFGAHEESVTKGHWN